MTTTKAPVENWFFSAEKVQVPGEPNRFAYVYTYNDPRPGNLEDQIVNDFLNNTNHPAWVGDDVEGELRIALRRAADAAVRTTLDAEAEQGVVYATAEERAAKRAAKSVEEILRCLRELRQLISGEAVQP